jgi:hypothetical protein
MPDLIEVLDRLMARIEFNVQGLEEGDYVRIEYLRNFIEDEKNRSRTQCASA